MKINEALDKLNSDISFKQYLKNNPKAYLSHFFMMMEKDMKNDWQIGYYNPDSNLVSTYIVTNKDIIAETPQEPFKKPEDSIARLGFDKIKKYYDDAIKKAKECLKKNYPKELPLKTMIILQNIKDFGNIWNITFVTSSFNTINIKIDAKEGNILNHEKTSFMKFKK